MTVKRAASRLRHQSYFAAMEYLESRLLLSSQVFASGHTATYTDPDGDGVTITVSKGNLSPEDFGSSPQGAGQQLDEIDLSDPSFNGTDLLITTSGFGQANVGYINASGINLGNVTVVGDLGRINAGSGHGTAVHSLTVQSIGEFGLSTQDGSGDLTSNLVGALGSLVINGDLNTAAILVTGGNSASIGSIDITGSLIGDANDFSGSIQSQGSIGSVRIQGSLMGDAGKGSAGITSEIGKIGSLVVGGSILGGSGPHSAAVSAATSVGDVSISGDVQGGIGDYSASIIGKGALGALFVGGSVMGGQGSKSASVTVSGAVQSITVHGDVTGSDGDGSGTIGTNNGKVGSISIGGSIAGGAGLHSGDVLAFLGTGSVSVGHDITGGSGDFSGDLALAQFSSFSLGGSLLGGNGSSSGLILGNGNFGPVGVTGNVTGSDGPQSGSIVSSNGKIAAVFLGGTLTGGAGDSSWQITCLGNLGSVTLGRRFRAAGVTRPVPSRPSKAKSQASPFTDPLSDQLERVLARFSAWEIWVRYTSPATSSAVGVLPVGLWPLKPNWRHCLSAGTSLEAMASTADLWEHLRGLDPSLSAEAWRGAAVRSQVIFSGIMVEYRPSRSVAQ